MHKTCCCKPAACTHAVGNHCSEASNAKMPSSTPARESDLRSQSFSRDGKAPPKSCNAITGCASLRWKPHAPATVSNNVILLRKFLPTRKPL
eukprot:8232614-Pyramimonas_sp.AAC.1